MFYPFPQHTNGTADFCPSHNRYRLLSHFLPDLVLSHIANGSITAMSHAKVNINASIFLIF